MKLRCAKFDPNGNITLLVTTPVPRAEHAGVAARLMAQTGAEQVGFVEPAALPGARARLQMMGGEFCGNASMSLAALLAMEDGLAEGAAAEVALEVSGAEGLVCCRVARKRGVEFLGAAAMPLPEGVGEIGLPDGTRAPLVRFPGIRHLIIPEGALSPAAAEAEIANLCARLGAEALGILLTGADGASIRPLVYVRATGSAVWESCCGSGAAALAAHAALQAGGEVELRVRQPGGRITARARCEGGTVRALEIRGQVRQIASGEVQV